MHATLRPFGGLVEDKHQTPDRGPLAMFGALTGIASLSAFCVVGGAALGLLVDRSMSAPPIFLFLGLLLGILAAVVATRAIVRRFFG